MKLTIVYCTSRYEPEFRWMLDSLALQVRPSDDVRVIIVDALAGAGRLTAPGPSVKFTRPKPTVWQGKHRLTKEDWWAMSNARNTGIIMCETEWICFLDDRSVLCPGWLNGIRRAQAENYVVCGAYMKKTAMRVRVGLVDGWAKNSGTDSRFTTMIDRGTAPNGLPFTPGDIVAAPGEWTYGCCIALPLEWALAVNGFDETCDGASHEDSMFGLMLANNGFHIKYDTGMWMFEDRTPERSGPVMRREDKGVSPDDKSHWLLEKLRGRKEAAHPISLRAMRKDFLAGNGMPKAPWGPTHDPYDNQPLSEM